MALEIRQLEYFLTVGRAGSFTRAAERLYVSQPAVTNAVRSLEEELGIQLFDRSQRLAALTSEGRIFFEHAERIMHGIRSTIAEIDTLKNLSGGHLSLGLTALGGMTDVSEVLGDFAASYADIAVHLTEASSKSLEQLLLADKLDLAVLIRPPDSAALSFIGLPPQEIVLVCGRRHRLRRSNSVALSGLTDEKLLIFPSATYREILVEAFAKADGLPQIKLESGHVQTLKSMAAAGLGITLLPESLVEGEDSLALVPLSPPLYLSPVLAYKESRPLSHAAAAFLEIAKKNWGDNHA